MSALHARSTRASMIVLAVIASLVFSGCGGSDGKSTSDLGSLSAKALLAKAKAAVKKQPNVTVDGAQTQSGTTVEIHLAFAGDDTTGTVTIDGGQVTLLGVGGRTFFKADDAFWAKQAGDSAQQVIATIQGRWIEIDAPGSSLDEFKTFASRAFLDEALSPEGTFKKGKAKTVDGVKALSLTDTKGTMYVDASNAKPLNFASNDDPDQKVTFSYDAIDAPTVPADAEIVPLSSLSQ